MRKIASIFVIGLLIAAAPALAQQKAASNNRAMKEAKLLEKKVTEVVNKKDAAGYAALYTSNGIFLAPDGSSSKGHAAIEALQAATFKAWGDYKFAVVTKDAGTIGNGIWTIDEATIDGKGPNGPISIRSHVLNILVPQGKDWKIAVTSVGLNVTPPGMPPQR